MHINVILKGIVRCECILQTEPGNMCECGSLLVVGFFRREK